MRKSFLLFLASACVGVSGCAGISPAMNSDIILDEPFQPSQLTALKIGQRLLIRLKENPTTGYIWEIKAVDPKILQPELPSYKSSAPERVGSGGVKTFVFNALSAGKTRVILINHRTWEKKDEKTIQLEVVVTE